MISYDITEVAVLKILSQCPQSITMNDLFEMIPEQGLPQDRAVTFVKTLNMLLEMELVETSHHADGLVYWRIAEAGTKYLNDFLKL